MATKTKSLRICGERRLDSKFRRGETRPMPPTGIGDEPGVVAGDLGVTEREAACEGAVEAGVEGSVGGDCERHDAGLPYEAIELAGLSSGGGGDGAAAADATVPNSIRQ